MMKRKKWWLGAICILLICASALLSKKYPVSLPSGTDEIPSYSGQIYVVLNDNQPAFTDAEMDAAPYERYSPLDALGRCGYAEACLSKALMPTEDRTSISHVKPSGWQTYQYDFVDGKYLYNRSHLIGFQLAGENDNENNLITGTRFFNVSGMLPFENMVADYIKETDNRVLYRVTPVYNGNDLVAGGVRMEAFSVEDNGEGICFHVFVYNVQPGVVIDYATGHSSLDASYFEKDAQDFVLNTNSKKFHKPTCTDAAGMKAENRKEVTTSRELLVAQGYKACGSCKP